MIKRSLPVVLLLGLLAGCATIVHPGGSANDKAWQARRRQLAQLRNWHISGRVGVSTPRRGGSASLDWRERDGQMTLLFSGPFGMGAVRMQGTAHEMHVRDSKGRSWVSYEPEAALESTLGWPLPIGSLRYWVLGLPAPGSAYHVSISSRGLLSRLVQQGWRVDYAAYQKKAGLFLPQNLVVTRGATRIKLIVSSWVLGKGKP